MQRSSKLLLLAAIFLVGLTLARQDDNQGPPPADGNGPRPPHPGAPDAGRICERIAKDCARDGEVAVGTEQVGTLNDLCEPTLCVPFLESHKCFLGCGGKCHRDHMNDQEAAKACAEECLTCVDEEAPQAPPAERKYYSAVRRAARRQGEGNARPHPPAGQHPNPMQICKAIGARCAEEGEVEGRVAKDELCDEATCVGWFQTHEKCFWGCANRCVEEHNGDKDATNECIETTCLACEEGAAPVERRRRSTRNIVSRAIIRQEEPPAEAPEGQGEEGPRPRGPRDPCSNIQKKCTPGEAAAARRSNRRQEGGVAKFEDLCDEQICHGYFENHHCAMGCLRDCHMANKEDLDAFKGCADQCVTCTDQEPTARRQNDGPKKGGKGGKGEHKPPAPEAICGKIAEKCAEEATEAPEARMEKQEFCELDACVAWFENHQQCFWKCAKQCHEDNKGDKDATEGCIESTCLACEEDVPAPARRRRVLRHH